MTNPVLDGQPVRLGDFLCYPSTEKALEAITGDGAMVRGWSPSGEFVVLGWAGIVPLADCTWADPGKVLPVHRLYKVPTVNQWEETVRLNTPSPRYYRQTREETLINEAGRIVVEDLCEPISQLLKANQNNEWRLPELVSKYVVPGIDANLCNCPKCEGIYWVDQRMREQAIESKRRKGRKPSKSRKAA